MPHDRESVTLRHNGGGIMRRDAPSPVPGPLGDGSQLSVLERLCRARLTWTWSGIDERTADGGEASRRTLEVHFKLFGTDGVSLQSQELSKALGASGWQAFSCASDVPPHAEGLTLPELSYQSPDAVALRKRVFSTSESHPPSSDGDSLVTEIIERAERIRRQIEDYVDTWEIPLLHVRNIMSLPYNLPATLALVQPRD